jgi:hypothetical protein
MGDTRGRIADGADSGWGGRRVAAEDTEYAEYTGNAVHMIYLKLSSRGAEGLFWVVEFWAVTRREV